LVSEQKSNNTIFDDYFTRLHNLFMRFFLSLVLLVTSAPLAQAQPVSSPLPRPPAPPRPASPEEQIEFDLKNLLDVLNTREIKQDDEVVDPNLEIASFISGSRIGYFGAGEWSSFFAEKRGNTQYRLDKITIQKLAGNAAQVKVNYALITTLPPFAIEGETPTAPKVETHFRAENLNLKRELLPWDRESQRWRIVPQKVKDLTKADPLSLLNIAYFAGQQPGTLWQLRALICVDRLKQCSLSMIQFSQDWDEKLLLQNEFWTQALGPYSRNNRAFFAPGTTQHYTFNDGLSDKNIGALHQPTRTVLFYEGENQKLMFRYDGKAVIACADGHVIFVTPQEAAQLIWKP
jgi:hypothetical protein